MQIIKLSATDSTNAHLKNLMLLNDLDDLTVVTTVNQTAGRGQMGAKWDAEPGKNLTFSILKKTNGLTIENQFRLNICISLAVVTSLKEILVPDITIKWPNDILSGTSKICGILIENILSGQKIQASVIGIGLNVNQSQFNNLSNASSLKLLLGRTFNLEELLDHILRNIEHNLKAVAHSFDNRLWNVYESFLFRKNKPSTFRNQGNEIFMGFIRGVSSEGKLIVALEDNVITEFDLKEVQLMY